MLAGLFVFPNVACSLLLHVQQSGLSKLYPLLSQMCVCPLSHSLQFLSMLLLQRRVGNRRVATLTLNEIIL